MFKRILIAYNGSDEGKRMLISSGELAAFTRAEMHLLAVAGMPSASLYASEGFLSEELIEEDTKRAQEILNEGIVQLQERGFTVAGHLAVGDPVEKICSLALELNCDLIVVGHAHRGKFGRWWQRSVGKSLLDNAPCAVLGARTRI